MIKKTLILTILMFKSRTLFWMVKKENREYAPLEKIQDNFPKYVLTTDF